MNEPALRLYNTLTRTKEAFAPADPRHVRMYVCGPTVYDYAHIGNARPVIVFDVLFRLLRHVYVEKHVSYVRNITDIDDKIIRRAVERGITIGELTTQTTQAMHQDFAAIGLLPLLAATTVSAHNFWDIKDDPQARNQQMTAFFGNLAAAGGLVTVIMTKN